MQHCGARINFVSYDCQLANLKTQITQNFYCRTSLQSFIQHPLIAHFTVTSENEAGVDLVLIQPLLLYYVN